MVSSNISYILNQILCLFIFLILIGTSLEANSILYEKKNESKKTNKKLIILSIDGFPGFYLESSYVMSRIPNLKKLFSLSIGGRVKTINPSLTYPAHTSMITGVNPGLHGIEGNRPIDPFGINNGDWQWYVKSRKVKSIVEFSKEVGLTTASIYWPVSVGEFTDWNIPQIWKSKTIEDEKIVRRLSTPGLYDEMIKSSGEVVSEITGDRSKINTGIHLFLKKEPDLTLIYSTDLDTDHHKYGAFSPNSLETLAKIDQYIGKLIESLNLYSRNDLGLIIVSDHGFIRTTRICRPNRILMDMGFLRPDRKTWDYYFHSSGGMAGLIANPNSEKGQGRFPKLNELKKRLESKCPSVQLEFKGNNFQSIKLNSYPNIQAIVTPSRSTYISSIINGKYYETNKIQNVHGFPNNWEEMDAILFFYGREYKSLDKFQNYEEISSIIDVSRIACNWLTIECRYGEFMNVEPENVSK